ncbi:hypothetical protein KTQ42_22930 [Noviherbaspirillum sp. L7-7A]|uniref:NACHT domain-containing protein n=1 Tax=Noviherbaspirillum sp. L7-7A TaxID=2850560 RepID=UPI001C2C4904|nr:hypothetical protein [Noviherbaspirillum sp. L7-7A]MBV0882135.1 hypothetical protein [Noviherbaspirillum sp. L7-7A]
MDKTNKNLRKMFPNHEPIIMKITLTRSSAKHSTLLSAISKSGISVSQSNAIRNWLVEQLIAHEHAKLGQGGHTQNQVPLRTVFVDLPVSKSINNEGGNVERVPFVERLLSSDTIRLRTASKARGTPSLNKTDIPNDDDQDFDIGENSNAEFGFSATLLIGGPGQGKSTLGQLACQLHRAALLKPLEQDLTTTQRDLVRSFEVHTKNKSVKQPLSLPKSPLLPLQISLPDFIAWFAKDKVDSKNLPYPVFLRFITDLKSARNCGLTAETLISLAPNIPFLIVLDGFDEVGAIHDRHAIVDASRELLTALSEKNALAQVIATTRPQGYAGELAQIGLPLTPRYLVPLLKNEALAYAQKLIEAKIPGADLKSKAFERIQEAAAEPSTERLLTTPLQVTILTALVQQLGRAPRERWNLFFRYFSYTYDREIERETYASRLLADHRSHIEQIHARVALLLQVEAERDGGAAARMPRSRLESVIEAVLSEDEVAEDERAELVKSISIAAEQRLVFLVEPEPGSFGFEIRSLQEFMAAWALTSGRDNEIEGRLQQVAIAPMFRNVTLFMASRLFSEGSPLRDILADRICGALDDDPNDYAAHLSRAGSLLALDTLEEGAVLSQPRRARALMERAVNLLSLPPGSEHLRLVRVVNSDTLGILRESIEKNAFARKKRFKIPPHISMDLLNRCM